MGVSLHHKIRAQRILRQAEGYLELDMPSQALETLDRLPDPGTFKGHARLLQGQALRSLQRYQEALGPLSEACDLWPSEIGVWLALAWCHKRTRRLDLAIAAMERALEVKPNEGILHYNLACYLSLCGQPRRSLSHLSRAIAIEPRYRHELLEESDFDPIRGDPGFQALSGVIV